MKRHAVSKVATAITIAVMVLVVAGLGTLFNQEPVTPGPAAAMTTIRTTTLSAAQVGCEFTNHQLQPSTTVYESYTGCLTSGSSGSYIIAVDDPNGMTLSATVSSKYPVQVTIAGPQVKGFPSLGQVVYANNDTTLATPSGIALMPQSGYTITVSNSGGANNTVTMILDLSGVSLWTNCAQ